MLWMWFLLCTISINGRKISRLRPPLYNSPGERLDVETTTIPRAYSAVNRRRRIMASAMSLTCTSSKQRTFACSDISFTTCSTPSRVLSLRLYLCMPWCTSSINLWKWMRFFFSSGISSKNRSIKKDLPHPTPPCKYTPLMFDKEAYGFSSTSSPPPNKEPKKPRGFSFGLEALFLHHASISSYNASNFSKAPIWRSSSAISPFNTNSL
mmetsp:Transcript_150627/g.263268  ORF Transcript_150627/g.263268 Transcript_150627/m.263268 type:complete len:209 (+) Transcript_150627:659-1285(+)